MEEPLLIKDKKTRKESANIFSKLLLLWVYPTIEKSQKETLSSEMIENLDQKDSSTVIHKRFQEIFKKCKGKHTLAKALIKTFTIPLIIMISILIVQISVQLMMPLLIKWTIQFISEKYVNPDIDINRGIYLVVAIFLCRLSYTLTNNHTLNIVLKIGYDTIAILGMAILDKSLKMSFLSNKNHSVGSVVTLMTVDAAKLQYTGMYFSAVGLLPLQMGVAIYMMFNFIGISFLGGLTVIIIIIFINGIISKYLMTYTIASMGCKDIRTKYATEIFQQIRFIKINAFEDYFLDKLKILRNAEVKSIKRRLLFNCINSLSIWLSPALIINATFAIFVFINGQMNAGDTFAVISIFQILQVPLLALPLSINALIDTNVSLQRIQKFLLDQEVMTECIQKDQQYSSQAISIQNGDFSWGTEEKEKSKEKTPQITQITDVQEFKPTLKNINFQIEKGQFVAIVGDVGSGKSSFLQAIIGEMLYNKNAKNVPKLDINGSIAYISQTAWIQNATLKDNILFGQLYDEQRYQEAIHYSCLEDDMKILIKGDQTMIGEKGVNLSGGQKARVSLARAIYSDHDIYLFDDPISAVDIHVGKFLMHECIKGYLKNKTRILVTHAINFTQFADYIYLMDQGSIVEQGLFNDLKTSSKFQLIYNKFFKEENSALNDEKKERNVQQQEMVVKEKQKQKQIPKQVEGLKDDVDELMLMEDKAQGSITWRTYFQYIEWNGLCMNIFIFFIMLIWIGTYMFSSIWMALWATNKIELTDTICLEIYLAAGLLQGFINFLRSILFNFNGINAANILHNKMVNTLIYAPICQFFERVPIGQILNRFSKDQNTLDVDLVSIFNWSLMAISILIANTALNVYSSTAYILLAIGVYFIIGFILQQKYIKASRDLFRLEAMTRSPIISYFSEAVSGLPLIRAFSKQSQFLQKHAQNYDNNRKIALEKLATSIWFGIILGLSSLIVNVFSVIFCVFFSTKNPGFAGILLTYASTLDVNVQQFVEATTWVETQMVSFERCMAYLKVKPEQCYQKLVEAKLNEQPHQEYHLNSWPTQGEIQYKNYSVRYRDGLPLALKDISFKIGPQQKIGVVGRTGAGKSTITLTLLRILEAAEGSIYVDGVDLATLSLKQVREQITMILQDSTIFNGTIRENIDPLSLRTDAEITSTLEQCCLSNFVDSRKGLDAKLDATNMSAGEKQLINIARAVLRKTKIVLIDEATANIDIETEQTIQKTIQSAFKDCTVITIAHRINTILHCDKILVIDQGTVKEFGETNQLLEQRDSIFYGIYQETLREQQQQS